MVHQFFSPRRCLGLFFKVATQAIEPRPVSKIVSQKGRFASRCRSSLTSLNNAAGGQQNRTTTLPIRSQLAPLMEIKGNARDLFIISNLFRPIYGRIGMTVLIVFATVEGQTEKIARFISGVAKNAGFNTKLINTDEMPGHVSIDDVVKVVLLAPVHERRHPESFEAFVTSNRDALTKRKSLVLSVGLKASFASGREEARDYLDEMLLRTGFEPNATALIAGAVRPENYGYFEREILQHVVLLGRKIDPRDGAQEFTNWDELTSIVIDFLGGTGRANRL